MTYIEVACEVLKATGRPMHHRDIYKAVVKKGLWVSSAQPQNVENSTYGTLIKAVQDGNPCLGRDSGDLALFYAR